MSTNYVTIGANRRIGYVKETNSVSYAQNQNGKNVGYFNKSSNTTFDSNGKRYGSGNLTNALIFKASGKF
jgi:hypothetical protein